MKRGDRADPRHQGGHRSLLPRSDPLQAGRPAQIRARRLLRRPDHDRRRAKPRLTRPSSGPLRSNVGGVVDEADAVGRHEAVRQLIEPLAVQSVQLTGSRRIGKTTTLHLLRRHLPADWRYVVTSVEGIGSAGELTDHLTSLLSSPGRRPVNAGGSWKTQLHELCAAAAPDEGALVLAIDEFPTMITSITHRSGAEEARDLIATLRAVRQENPTLRMVIAGERPAAALLVDDTDQALVNDLTTIRLGPLEDRDATTLATRLLEGRGLPHDVATHGGRAIIDAVGGHPFHIQAVAAEVSLTENLTILDAVDHALIAFADDDHAIRPMARLFERLGEGQHGERRRNIALTLVDQLARGEGEAVIDDLVSDVAEIHDAPIAEVRTVLRELELDGLVVRRGDRGALSVVVRREDRTVRSPETRGTSAQGRSRS